MTYKGSELNVSNLMSDKEKRNTLRDRPKEPYGEYPRRIWVHPIDYDRSDLRNAWVVMQEEEGAVEFVKSISHKHFREVLSEIIQCVEGGNLSQAVRLDIIHKLASEALERERG